MSTQILTVCTGNMCRSPLAERLLVLRAGQRGLDVTVEGGGTKARNGVEMHPETQRVLRGYGGDPDGFGSRLLTPTLIRGKDLILTATAAHSSAVAEQFPVAWRKTFTLIEAAAIAQANPEAQLGDLHRLRRTVEGAELDVVDPIGQSAEVFDSTGAQISHAVDAIVDLLARLEQ